VSVPSEPLRLGVAGFGRLVRDVYLPAFRSLRDARLVAVADPLPASRSAAAKLLKGAAVHSDHRGERSVVHEGAVFDHVGPGRAGAKAATP